MTLRLGADIGGTFTDFALADGEGRIVAIGKRPTTPERPDDAVVAGAAELLARAGVPGRDVSAVVHGATLFTNALIERKGARTALVTTRGFRDAVEIGREHRYDMYDLRMERPEPLAPRRLRFEATERVLADGTVRAPLDEAEARALARRLAGEVEAVAVCFLHSYAFPAHERRMGEILAEEAPGLEVTLSHEVAPEIREFDRATTALANVYVKRIAARYLARLEARLRDELGVAAPLHVMQSNGGLVEVADAARLPIRLVESGPAGGALAAAGAGAGLGLPELMSLDMGGTTAKACLIENGAPLVATGFEVDRRYKFKKGSGLPVRISAVDMIEIGAGGGSLARVDRLGRLKVGPESAGAEPGPACYGQGGRGATVTDADLILGRLDPGFFLGGEMRLDAAAARAALERDVAGPLGLSVEDAAHAVSRVADEAMAAAARLHAVERGRDVSRFALFAFGGAGPVHAFGVARILRCPRVVYPPAAGVLSAAGFLAAPTAFDFVAPIRATLAGCDWAALAEVVAGMAERGRAVLARAGAPVAALRLTADMRWRGQGHELAVAVPGDPLALSPATAGPLRAAFEAAYRAQYGQTPPQAEPEATAWRLVVEGPRPALRFAAAARGGEALKGRRRLRTAEGVAEVPVFDRYALRPGAALDGPAIVEERESAVVIDGPARIHAHETGALIVETR